MAATPVAVCWTDCCSARGVAELTVAARAMTAAMVAVAVAAAAVARAVVRIAATAAGPVARSAAAGMAGCLAWLGRLRWWLWRRL